jgi:hypothetical protein
MQHKAVSHQKGVRQSRGNAHFGHEGGLCGKRHKGRTQLLPAFPSGAPAGVE